MTPCKAAPLRPLLLARAAGDVADDVEKSSSSGLDFLTVGDFWGPPMAHVDPAPPGPKDCKHRGEELVSYQFIRETAGQKVSPLAGSVVVALTDKMLLS